MSTITKEENLRQALKEASRVVCKRKPVSAAVFNRIEDAIFKKICEIRSLASDNPYGSKLPRLSNEHTKRIAADLVIRDVKSPATLLQWTILNDLIEQLINHKIIHEKSKYLNVPLQIKRQILSYPEEGNVNHVAHLTVLKERLLSLEIPKFASSDEEEIDYVCSYLASCVLFAKVLIPDFQIKLLKIRHKDLSYNPASVMLSLKGLGEQEDGAFYRYFLPAPASIYLLRCMLFYIKKNNNMNLANKSRNQNGFIFELFLQKFKNIDKIFRKWLIKRLSLCGIQDPGDLSLRTFRDVAFELTVIETSSISYQLPTYPPFLISIQAGKIRSDSCVPSQFMLSPDHPIRKEDYNFLRRSKKDIAKKTVSPLSGAFRKVNAVLKNLKKGSSLGERRIIAGNMRFINQEMKTQISSGSFENLSLSTELVCRMLVIKKGNSKSKIINISTAVRNIIFNLPSDKPIYELPKAEILAIVKTVSEPYKSDTIINGAQTFFDFLHSHLGSKFPVLKISSSEINKKSSQFPTPLIYYFHVDKALAQCEKTFCRHALRLKNEVKKLSELNKALYRASMAQHMINFGYYGGNRESEFTGLKIRNVICDPDGLIVCIRDSKTNNGKRNIPMYPLFPDSYQSAFQSYYEKRLSEATSGDDWLFPDHNGKRLNANFMAGRIKTVFKDLGILNMVYHDLRHGFASFFLLRVFNAFYPEFALEGLQILNYELFKEPYVSRLKTLILGGNRKTGQDYLHYGIAALSILIGHGGPITTFEEYVHTADWIFWLISKSLETRNISITSQQAANMLQVSYPTLTGALKGRSRKTISYAELRNFQFQQRNYGKSLKGMFRN